MTRPWGTSRSVTSAPVLRGGALLAVVAAALLVAGLAAAPPARGDIADWRAPFTLTPGLGLVAQYGYAPQYTRNVPAFDSADRAYIRSRTAARDTASYVGTLEGGAWARLDFRAALLAAYPDFVGTVGAGGWRSDGVVFDRQDRAYNPLTIQLAGGATRNVLLVSWDLCRTWKVFELPDGEFAVEHWVGHNEIDGPPFLAFWQPSFLPYAGRHGGRYTLWVTQPRLEGEDLVIPTPALVTNACLGFTRHSGGASFAVTHGESTWFVWPGTARSDAAGVPQYVARYDHPSGTVGEAVLLTRTPPANDPHNTPGICLDSQGYLHVVGGTHGTAVPYQRSLSPYSSDGGWTPPEPVLSDGYTTGEDPPRSLGRQTYDSFVCDSQNTLHLVTRQARRGVDAAFEGRYYAALIHQSRPAGASWSAPTVIVVPPARGYSVYYHKLALDHRDRLFLSCSYTGGETMWADRARVAGLSVLGRAQPWRGTYRRRLLLVSEDHGASWRFATDRDLSGGAEVAPAPSRAAPARSGGGAPPGGLDWLNPAPQGDQLTAIDFVDSTRGWAAGTLGAILKTTDGGRTWSQQGSFTEAPLFGLAAVDRATAWAVGEGGVILHTADGGHSWIRQTSGTSESLLAVSAISRRRAWIVGTRGVALATRDGGRSWQRQFTRTAENLFAVDFIDALHGWMAGNYGYILRTRDGGRTWRQQEKATSACIHGISFFDTLHGVAVGKGGVVLRSADGGARWHKATSGVTTQLSAVRMLSAGRAWASGAAGVMLGSEDGGRTWRVRHLPVRGMAGALDSDGGRRLWAAGVAGTVSRSSDGGQTWWRLTRGITASLEAAAARGPQLWVGGAGGLLAYRDGGSWRRIALETTHTVEAIAFDDAEGWAVGTQGSVVHSADGGGTWAQSTVPATTDLSAVAALGGGRAWVAGDRGTLLSTGDGGTTWQASAAAPQDLACLAFVDDAHGWAGGGAPFGEAAGLVLRTEDGGATWEGIATPLSGRILGLSFVDAEHGWAAAEDWGADGDDAAGAVLTTADGGRTWTTQATCAAVLTSISMDSGGSGWAFGAAGAALATSDGGATWHAVSSGTDNALRACAVPGTSDALTDGVAGWAAGDDGTVLTLHPAAP